MAMARSIRTTVSVPAELYAALTKAAKSSHVSTAWVIRDALRLYLSGERKGARASVAAQYRAERNVKQAKTG
jgi:hypothetical protein